MTAAQHGAALLSACPPLAAYAGGGLLLGIAYFATLLWSTRRLAAARLGATLGLMACRLLVLAIVLALASTEGAGPLLATTLGLLAGRSLVMRRVLAAAP